MKRLVLSSGRALLLSSISGLLLMAVASPAPAQETESGSIDHLEQAAVQKLTEIHVFGGTFEGALLSDDSGVAIEVGEEKEVASFRVAWSHLRNRAALTLSSPVDKDSGRADFVGFGGVNDAATATLDYTRVWWPRVDFSSGAGLHDSSAEDRRKIQELTTCSQALWILQRLGPKLMARGVLNSDLIAVLDKVKEMDLTSMPTLIPQYIEVGADEDALSADEKKRLMPIRTLEDVCQDDLYIRLTGLLENSPVQLPRRASQGKRVFFWNLQGQVGSKDFEFFDATDLSDESSRKTPTSLGFSIGWIFLSQRLGSLDDSIALTFRREHGYESAKAASLCETLTEPVPESGKLERCKSQPLGPPTEVDADFLGFEYRHLQKAVGTGIRVFYRGLSGKEDDYGVEVPFYFLPNKEGKLAGGLRFGWSEVKKGDISIFVSKTFGTLPSGVF